MSSATQNFSGDVCLGRARDIALAVSTANSSKNPCFEPAKRQRNVRMRATTLKRLQAAARKRMSGISATLLLQLDVDIWLMRQCDMCKRLVIFRYLLTESNQYAFIGNIFLKYWVCLALVLFEEIASTHSVRYGH